MSVLPFTKSVVDVFMDGLKTNPDLVLTNTHWPAVREAMTDFFGGAPWGSKEPTLRELVCWMLQDAAALFAAKTMPSDVLNVAKRTRGFHVPGGVKANLDALVALRSSAPREFLANVAVALWVLVACTVSNVNDLRGIPAHLSGLAGLQPEVIVVLILCVCLLLEGVTEERALETAAETAHAMDEGFDESVLGTTDLSMCLRQNEIFLALIQEQGMPIVLDRVFEAPVKSILNLDGKEIATKQPVFLVSIAPVLSKRRPIEGNGEEVCGRPAKRPRWEAGFSKIMDVVRGLHWTLWPAFQGSWTSWKSKTRGLQQTASTSGRDGGPASSRGASAAACRDGGAMKGEVVA
mmetsp:Transcript_153393/g.491760  ORF Transcript_153393/g.491760 Transcript_153393/m.491760 type:complete len:349 (+) Transcript_153393:41-1087(+)